TTMSKQLRVKVSYSGESDKDVAAEAVAALDGLTGNANFVDPPIDLAVFKAAVEAYASAIATVATDGGKKAIANRSKQRTIVTRMLRVLGHWVEANSQDNLSILKSSGFQTVSTTRVPVQPLAGRHRSRK